MKIRQALQDHGLIAERRPEGMVDRAAAIASAGVVR